MMMPDGREVCDCSYFPVMWWNLPELGWQVMFPLWDFDQDAVRDPFADLVAFEESGATEWRVLCPGCQQVHLEGVSQHSRN